MQGAPSLALRLLPLICCVCAAAGYPFKTPLDLDVTPRVTVLRSGKHGRTCAHTAFLFRACTMRENKNVFQKYLKNKTFE